ncbi:hypothetical protein [Geofilum rubicundum]|uniref:Uncharacterized protein n=1 Tax=Geofilum rubicundum JCM 15548 TaxID=1236989 RepID=A0A0E9LUG5_9BACT|nr:hypothetical protein [Geofilum rubicundum]GAO28495.1 hypothetical protein JCM15548_1600 [Geofilum rubicundum JCM 15548]
MDKLNIGNGRQWWPLDFDYYHAYWSQIGIERSLAVRKDNLSVLEDLLTKSHIHHWMYGSSLSTLFHKGTLSLTQAYDEMAIEVPSSSKDENHFFNQLSLLGFDVVNRNDLVVVAYRKGCYVRLFRFQKGKLGYTCGTNRFSFSTVGELKVLDYNGLKLRTPGNTQVFINRMQNVPLRFVWINFLSNLGKASNYWSFYKRMVRFYSRMASVNLLLNSNWLLRTCRMEVKKLTEDEFRDMLIEPNDSPNWYWRKDHYDLITNQRKLSKVGDIIDYFKADNRLNSLTDRIVETELLDVKNAHVPLYKNLDFWQKGNNYFINSIRFSFRKGVVPYGEALEYIRKMKYPILYSSDYYKGLKVMSDMEIAGFSKKNLLTFHKGACIHGRHRVCAMMGRIIQGQPYIPMYALVYG